MLDIIVPFLANVSVPNTAVDWNYSTTPQIGLNERVLPYPRGFVLGGTSSVSKPHLFPVSSLSDESQILWSIPGVGGFIRQNYYWD